jgi:DNA polymerase III sliding clamp (beta) subunit (PCNA family)
MIEINQRAFRRALKRVLLAVDERNARVALTGVWFGLQGGTLTLCGSDGFRMHLDQSISIADAHEFSMLIPAASLRSLLATLPTTDLPIYLARAPQSGGDEGRALIRCGAYSFSIDLIRSDYPDIQKVARQGAGDATRIILNRKALLMALRRGRSIIKERDHQTTVFQFYRPTAGDEPVGRMRMQRQTGAVYETEFPAQANIASGVKNYLLINARYLIDALQSLPDDQIECWLNFAPESVPGTDTTIGLNRFMIRLIGHTSELKYQAFIMPIWFDMERLLEKHLIDPL